MHYPSFFECVQHILFHYCNWRTISISQYVALSPSAIKLVYWSPNFSTEHEQSITAPTASIFLDDFSTGVCSFPFIVLLRWLSSFLPYFTRFAILAKNNKVQHISSFFRDNKNTTMKWRESWLHQCPIDTDMNISHIITRIIVQFYIQALEVGSCWHDCIPHRQLCKLQ